MHPRLRARAPAPADARAQGGAVRPGRFRTAGRACCEPALAAQTALVTGCGDCRADPPLRLAAGPAADFDQDGWNDLFVAASGACRGDDPLEPDGAELRGRGRPGPSSLPRGGVSAERRAASRGDHQPTRRGFSERAERRIGIWRRPHDVRADCGHIDRANRVSQARFACRSCGFVDHADRNGSRNIRAAAGELWRRGAASTAPVPASEHAHRVGAGQAGSGSRIEVPRRRFRTAPDPTAGTRRGSGRSC
ncbi:zinc ribbon domain-containing protein [Streptomyces sp. NPDC017179]|uniref:zinc ribbon domain-containing protein n=1 Tax=Streptomyces sp. NPDC017179 TaxID=3364979 RepID=UPI0037ADA499